VSAWGVLVGEPPVSREFRRSCAWMQERLDGVVLVTDRLRHVSVGPRLRWVNEPASARGAVGRLVAGLEAAPADTDLLVYVESEALDAVAQTAVAQMLEAMDGADAAVVRGAPITDALKDVRGRRVHGSVDRSSLYRIVSPMLLRRRPLATACASVPDADALDPAELLLAAGCAVRMFGTHPVPAHILPEHAESVAR
jgi:hypothetical protein